MPFITYITEDRISGFWGILYQMFSEACGYLILITKECYLINQLAMWLKVIALLNCLFTANHFA